MVKDSPPLQQKTRLVFEILQFYQLAGLDHALIDDPRAHLTVPELTLRQLKPQGPASKSTIASKIAEPKNAPKLSSVSHRLATQRDYCSQNEKKALSKNCLLLENSHSLADLRQAYLNITGFSFPKGEHNIALCEGDIASDIIFIDGQPAPDAERNLRPFGGRSQKLFEAMLSSIGLQRDKLYLISFYPWNSPIQLRLTNLQIAILKIFLARHIALANAKIIVPMGQKANAAFFSESSFNKNDGNWHDYKPLAPSELPIPLTVNLMPKAPIKILPMPHPNQLLTNSELKKKTWITLLKLAAFQQKI